MKQFVAFFAAFAKSLAVYIAVVVTAAAIFGFFGIYVFHAKFSVKGCSILLAISAILWIWACWRSEEPALRTFVTLSLHSTLVFLLFLGISLLRFMLTHSNSIAGWHVALLVATGALFWYLRGIAIRRNKETKTLSEEKDVA